MIHRNLKRSIRNTHINNRINSDVNNTQPISHKPKPRRLGEGLIIGDNIKITVGQIGIEAPKEVVVAREEVQKKEE